MADNIKIKNIYYMLAYAYQSLNEAGFRDVASEDFEHIHDLFASILAKGISNQVKHGLHRDYQEETDSLGCLRGKIDMTQSVKQQTMTANKMVCRYDVFSEDTLVNRILKSTINLLIRHGDVKIENRKALRKLLAYFSFIKAIEPMSINWSAVRYHRNNATYKLLVNICWLVIAGLLQTTEQGNYRLASFLDDQQMYRLYEKFVLSYYQTEFPQYAASAAYIDWNTEDDKLFLPAMKSDITLSYENKVLIIDTKYYGHTLQHNAIFDSTSIISANLYQIFAYVKNKDKDSTGNVSGVLLYAKSDEEITPHQQYQIGGNHFAVETLNLGLDWEEIKWQLNSLPERYL